MGKNKNSLLIVLLFSLIWVVRPISYQEMRNRHPIYSQELKPVINKSSSFSFKRRCINLEDFDFYQADDLKLLQTSNQIILPTIINSSIDSIEEVKVSSSKNEFDIKTKNRFGKNSIFVEGFQAIRTFPTGPTFNFYNKFDKRIIKPSIMLQAHQNCLKEILNLPREITKKDKTVKFDKKYSGLFKENFEIFGYNLYLEENISKNDSTNKIKQAKNRLFKKFGETSKQYLRTNLFENPCIIKYEECKYLDTNYFVTIYYDELKDIFAIVNSKSNCLLEFGMATELKYAEIFAYKSFATSKAREICLLPNQQLLSDFLSNPIPNVNPPTKSPESEDLESEELESKALEVYKENYILSYEDALAILEEKYGSNFINIEKGEFKIQDWQAAKKIEHAVCFGINPESYGFSQEQAKEINGKGGIIGYVRRGKKLPSLDLIKAYQYAIKTFCENRNQSERNDDSVFRGEPAITFFNKQTRQVVIFNRETKIFITGYKIAPRSVDNYKKSGSIGEKF